MTTKALELRLKFLKEAAHSMAVASPTVSATLGAAGGSLLIAEEEDVAMPPKDWNALRRETCGACGVTMIPGWTCEVAQQLRMPGRSKSSSSEPWSKDKQLVYSCLRCDRRTVQDLQNRPPKHLKPRPMGMRDDVSLQKTPSKSSVAEESRVVKSANATSKQRKKARKGGLQAMLDRSKTATSAGNQLDLMDFLT